MVYVTLNRFNRNLNRVKLRSLYVLTMRICRDKGRSEKHHRKNVYNVDNYNV